MKNKNKLKEAIVGVQDYKKIRPQLSKDELKDLVVVDTDIDVDSLFTETDGIIEPQDQATIKYLSNVKDVNTGKVSQPFTIADKNYQMVRGVYPDGNVDMAVYCLDDMDDSGNNVIYSIDEFEQKIALPMKERLEMENTKIKSEDETYEGYKHFFVNKKTNEVKKFKTIDEMLSCGKMKDEEYMSTPRFKKYKLEKLFGKRNRLNELGMDQANLQPAQGADDKKIATSGEDMHAKSEKLMDIIDDNPKIQNSINTIKQNPKAQAEVIAAFAELVGVPRNGLTNLVSQIKDAPKQQAAESKVITKKSLEEGLKVKRNVIKTLKVKDIK